jgi:hypothetical protein
VKYVKISRLFGLVIILSLLVLVMPAAPAQAAASITLVPVEGAVESTVTVIGEDFNASSDTTDRYAVIYFTSQEATAVDDIDSDVTIYEVVKDGVWLDENGEFEVTFTVPTELEDGSSDADVFSGTYYICACYYVGTTPATRIRAVAEFTVIGGEITLSEDNGPVGTEVEITGAEFNIEETITIEYDGEEIDLVEGDDETDSDGEFVSSILIPESTTGDHTITLTVSGNEIEADFTVEPEIVLNPTSGGAETAASVSGTGFGRRADVVVYFDNKELVTETTDTEGSFDVEFTVPDLEAGIYDVETEDEDENLDAAKFTITVTAPPSTTAPPTPTPTTVPAPPTPTSTPTSAPVSSSSATTASINQTSGYVGTAVMIGGAGFASGETIVIRYDDQDLITAQADVGGIFVAAFNIPASPHGDHTITASDGISTEEFTFTMESEAPSVPVPIMPEMGIQMESPILFGWEKVTDDSFPVTYTLQVAANPSFSTGAIIMEKEGLTASAYTATDAEEEELAGKETAYYWRVRAVDAAANEGEWTGPGEFYIGEPFSLPNWLLYTLLGLGGLLLFVVGYYLGRRTAYY